MATMLATIEAILAALNEAGVRYLVVGGVAVVLHGELRITADLDLVVQLDFDNASRTMTTLERLGFRPRAPVTGTAFADASVRKSWIEQKGLTVFSLWSPAHPGFELDLFVSEPFDFDAVYGRALRVPVRATYAVVLSIDDLIAMKRAVGRGRDLDDVAALEALRDRRPPTGLSG
jgi:hypothetical protein